MRLFFDYNGHQIELIELNQSKFLFMATKSELYIDRQLIGSVEGFSFKEKIEGEFIDKKGIKHQIEIEKLSIIGKSIRIYLDGKIILSIDESVESIILVWAGVLSIVCIFLLVIFLIILFT